MAPVERWMLDPDDVLNHIRFDASGHVPLAWEVIVVKAGNAWEELMQHINDEVPKSLVNDDVHARSVLEHFPDEDDVIARMYFRSDQLYVGSVAHEALHVASWMCRYIGNVPRRMTMGYEHELLAEIVGELTSVTWYNLEPFWCNDMDSWS